MKRITKQQAKQIFNTNKTVYFMPSRLDANHSAFAPSTIKKEFIDCSFDEYIKDYEKDICSKYVGEKVSFWYF